MEEKTELFRHEALQAKHQPDNIHTLLKATSAKSWIIFVCLSFIVIAIVIWAFFGSIPTYVNGQGIITPKDSLIISAESELGPATVTSITTQPGATVVKNTIIAHLTLPELRASINTKKSFIKQQQLEFERLNTLVKKQISQRQKKSQDELNRLQNMIKHARSSLKKTDQLLKEQQRLLSRGLETKQTVYMTNQRHFDTLKEIEQTQRLLINTEMAKNDFIQQWHDKVRQFKLRLDEQKNEYAQMQAKYNAAKVVRSPANGHVLSIQVNPGDVVKAGSVIATLLQHKKQPKNASLQAITYIPATMGKNVKPNMQALVTPSVVKKEEYGSIIGTVTSISEYPINPETLMANLQNQSLVKQMTQDKPVISTIIHLQPDASSPSKLKWSSKTGPDQTITPGTVVSVRIRVKSQPPISLFIPSIKSVLGIQ